jgi:hypothetical protein
MDPFGFGRIIADKWDILMMSPGAFWAVLGFGFFLGLAITRAFLNERLTRQQMRITDLEKVLDGKLSASFLPPPLRKRSKQMSFGLVLIFVGVVAAFVGALLVARDSGPQTKVATPTGPVAPSVVAPVIQNPIPPPLAPVQTDSHSSVTIQSLSSDQRTALARDLYKLKLSIPIIYLTESGVQPPSHERSVFVGIFQKAGIQPATTFQEVEGPDQTGLLLCVPNVNSIPEKVSQLAEVLRKYGIETAYAPLVQSRISSTVPPEVEFVLFVGPKS